MATTAKHELRPRNTLFLHFCFFNKNQIFFILFFVSMCCVCVFCLCLLIPTAIVTRIQQRQHLKRAIHRTLFLPLAPALSVLRLSSISHVPSRVVRQRQILLVTPKLHQNSPDMQAVAFSPSELARAIDGAIPHHTSALNASTKCSLFLSVLYLLSGKRPFPATGS